MATCPTCNNTGVVTRPGNETFTRSGPPHYSAGTRVCPQCKGASSIDLSASNQTAPTQGETQNGMPDKWNAGFNGA